MPRVPPGVCLLVLLLPGLAMAQLGTPSAHIVQVAREAGLAAVAPGGGVAGPFEGPAGTLYYLDRQRRISFFHPTHHGAYFGILVESNIYYRYALDSLGPWVVDADHQFRLVRWLPPAALDYPHAGPVVQVLGQYLATGQPPTPGDAWLDWAALAEASAQLHDSNLRIIDTLEANACDPRHQGEFYLGCW